MGLWLAQMRPRTASAATGRLTSTGPSLTDFTRLENFNIHAVDNPTREWLDWFTLRRLLKLIGN